MILFSYVVNEEDENNRIDKVLKNYHQDESRAQIQKWIVDEYVTVNDRIIKSNYKCQEGDRIVLQIPEEEQQDILSENIPLKIVYEDDDLIVINKSRGMVVHPTDDQREGTLVNALLYYSKSLSKIGGRERPGIVHRLDKDTAGLLVVAKTNEVHLALVEQFKEKTVERIYEAIVHGVIPHETGVIDAPIGRNPKKRLQMDVVDDGKEAITHFQVLKRYAEFTHIICRLETGRTHQIRVHMSYIDHPLVGDPKYTQLKKTFKDVGQALFAKKLGFTHPIKNEWMEFEVERPDYFKVILTEIDEL